MSNVNVHVTTPMRCVGSIPGNSSGYVTTSASTPRSLAKPAIAAVSATTESRGMLPSVMLLRRREPSPRQ